MLRSGQALLLLLVTVVVVHYLEQAVGEVEVAVKVLQLEAAHSGVVRSKRTLLRKPIPVSTSPVDERIESQPKGWGVTILRCPRFT